MPLMDFFKRKPDGIKRASPASVSLAQINQAQRRRVEEIQTRWRGRTPEMAELQARAHGTAFTLAMLNARVMAQVPVRLYEAVSSKTGGKRKHKHLRDYTKVGRKAAMYADRAGDVREVTDHPVLDLLNDPNPHQSAYEMRIHRFANGQLFGNAYLAMTDDGHFVSLLAPYVRIVVDDEGGLIHSYEIVREDTRIAELPAEQVIHFKTLPSLENPYYGVGPLHNCIAEMDLDDAAMAAEIARWEDGGFPSMIVSLKGGTSQQIDETQNRFEQIYAGPANNGRMIVTGDATVTPTNKPNEMGYVEGLDVVTRRMLAAFGIPESMYRLNDANLASSLTGDVQYMRNTVQPELSNDCEQMTDNLLPMYGLDPGRFFFAPDDVVPEDVEAMRLNAQVYVAGGVMTINEQRESLGLEPIEGADELRVNGVPLDKLGQQPAMAPNVFTLTNTTAQETKRADDPASDSASDPDPVADPADSPKAKALAWPDDDPYAPGAPCGCSTKDAGEAVQETGAEAFRGLEQAVAGWFDELAQDLDRYVSGTGRVDLSGTDDDLLRRIAPHLERAFVAGAFDSLDKLADGGFLEPDEDGNFTISNVDAEAYLEQRGSLIIEDIRGTTEDALRRRILQGMQEGESLGELIPGVRDAFREATPARAEAIARTETSNAIHASEIEQFKQAGVEYVSWQNSPSPSAVHAELARRFKKHPVGEVFIKAGTTISAGGETETYTRDVKHPPARTNCRCWLLPVDGGDE